jgi:hypothetical protein
VRGEEAPGWVPQMGEGSGRLRALSEDAATDPAPTCVRPTGKIARSFVFRQAPADEARYFTGGAGQGGPVASS